MTYIVVYPREDGSSGVEECADLDLAIVTAERLRNVDSVERPRIFETSEITYDFKPYYRVEVTTAAPNSAASSTETITAEDSEPENNASDVPASPVVDVSAQDTAEEDSAEEEAVAQSADEASTDSESPVAETANDQTTDSISTLAEKAEAAAAKAGEAPAEAPTQTAKSGSGLFGDRSKSADSAEFPTVTKEDAPGDAAPPRRGLFGR